MTRISFAQDLESAAQANPDLAPLLRRAALQVKIAGSIQFDEDVEEALAICCASMGAQREEAIRQIMRDWLIGHGYLEWVEEGEPGL
jgi:hypothetical protein